MKKLIVLLKSKINNLLGKPSSNVTNLLQQKICDDEYSNDDDLKLKGKYIFTNN